MSSLKRAPSPTPSSSSRTGKQKERDEDESHRPTLVAIEQPLLKVPMPDPFEGVRSKLKSFLVKVGIYIAFNQKKFPDESTKVVFCCTLLKGVAFNWIKPFVIDYMTHEPDQWKLEMRTIFASVNSYKWEITRVFRDIDEERTAERSLQNLRQRGAASQYAAEFQQHASRVDWNDGALTAQFYRGLKDPIKDEIAKSDRPLELNKMMNLAIKIDNQMFERS